MSGTEIDGLLEEQKGKLKQKLAALTENDRMLEEGKSEELNGKLHIRLGQTKQTLNKLVSEL